MTTKPKNTSNINRWQQQGLKVVLATGVFDLLHIEHIRFLQRAKQAGDKLIVGIETDGRVKTIKGPERPINNQTIRLEQLQALKSVDEVFVLPASFSSQQDWETFIRDLRPDIYAVSSHSLYQENKKAICQKFGVNFMIVHEHNPSISTSKIIKDIC